MNADILLEMLDEKMDSIFDDKRYKEFMQSIGRFHQYSFSNQCLIVFQCPNAFKVAGYKKWKEAFGRQVKRGEKGIGILAPKMTNIYILKSENRPLKYNEMSKAELKAAVNKGLVEKKRGKRGFIGVTVFDIAQTEGPELEVSVDGLKGGYKDIDKLFKAITRVTGAKITRTDNLGNLGAMGYFIIDSNEIYVRDLSDVQVAKTALHEASHSLAKRFKADGDVYEGAYRGWESDKTEMMKLSKQDEEVIVESAAYIVLSQLGVDTSEYSFNYIMHWATAYRSTEEGKQKMQTLFNYIAKIADKLLSAIEDELGITEDRTSENDEDNIREEMADNLLSTMEANAVRVTTNGGVVV